MSFWSEASERHQQIAETYYRNIEYDHPGAVTSNRLAPFTKYGRWNRTTVKYYRYNGPNVQKL